MPRTERRRQMGRYTLVRRLAVGGMAEVHLAKAEGAGGFEKPVAIKRIHPEREGDATAGLGLSEEATLTVSLVHPNIVRTLDLGDDGATEFIVMEHVEGYDVQRVLDALRAAGSRFSVTLAAHVIAEVCRGLHHAHQHFGPGGVPANVVHRDVSPQNILLSKAGEVKIADFGVAKTIGRDSSPDAKVIKGKYFYMSPEQASAAPLDHRSDVFSAGVVLWELLVGRRLHQARDVPTLLERVRRAEIPPPSALRSDVPPELDSVVARATRRLRSERYPHAAAMADDLTRYLMPGSMQHFPKQIRKMLEELEPVLAEPCDAIAVPRTRDRVVTVGAPKRGTPPDPPFRHALDDGSSTLAGWQRPPQRAASSAWMWMGAAGAVWVLAAAWWMFGA